MPRSKPNAVKLEQVVWEAILDLKAGKIQADVANAMFNGGRVLIQNKNMQMQGLNQARKPLTPEILEFIAPKQNE